MNEKERTKRRCSAKTITKIAATTIKKKNMNLRTIIEILKALFFLTPLLHCLS